MPSLLSKNSTRNRDQFYKTAGKNVNSVPVYSYLQVKDSKVLSDMKSNFRVGDDTCNYVDSLVDSMKIPVKFDLILSPGSTSKVLNYFVGSVASKYKVPAIADSFIKSTPNDITFSTGDVVLDYKTLQSMIKIIDNAKSSGKFELKKVRPIQFRKFFTNLMTSKIDIEKIADKKILLIDDIITSGSTMNDIFVTLMRYGADDVHGLTLIKKL